VNATLIISSLGGIIAFLTVVAMAIRATFRIVNTTEDNTDALKENTNAINQIISRLNHHETRLGILEDRVKRGNP
jgi:hypothetical protein